LERGPESFVAFHVGELSCEFCAANLEDLREKSSAEVDEALEAARESTLRYLRSRTRPD
jgi:hypothetical protein